MESITQALQELEKVLIQVKEFLNQVRDKERIVSRLHAKISALDTKKVELEASLPQREAEFLVIQKKKGEEIISEATRRAEDKRISILSGAKADLENLVSKNNILNKKIADLDAFHLKKTAEITASVKELEDKRDALAKEIVPLTNTRDELQKQVALIKRQVAGL